MDLISLNQLEEWKNIFLFCVPTQAIKSACLSILRH